MSDIIKAWIAKRRSYAQSATSSLPLAVDALEAVLELHYPEPYAQGPDYCSECEHRFPCPTIKAIEEKLHHA